MKIGHLISNYFPKVGGAQICVHNVAMKCAERGHESVIMTTAAGRDPEGILGYNIIRLSPLYNRLLSRNLPLVRHMFKRTLSAIQERYGFDLWQVTFGFPLGTSAIDFFKKNNIPCVLRCTGEDLQMAPDIKYGYRLNKNTDGAIKSGYKKFDGLIALGESMKKDYVSLGIPEDIISLIPNGVDCSRFEAASRSLNIKRELRIDDSCRVLLTVGRNHPKKGFALIPQIIKRILKRHRNFRWLVIGKESHKIKELARKQGVAEYVVASELNPEIGSGGSLQAPSDRLVQYYKSADAFVFPTLIETFGKVVIEAMAAGLPVVTTDAAGVTDIIQDGVNGIKVKIGDAEAMADAVIRVLDDEALGRRLGAKAAADSKSYDWPRITDMYIALYEKLIRQKRR